MTTKYKRLIFNLLHNDLIDYSRLEKRAMHRRVAELTGRFRGRCHAMLLVANEFCCSYEKVRSAVYEIDKQQSNFSTMESSIKINNEAEVATIDIEGTIGLSEEWQFDNPESRVATYERFKECVARIADIKNAHIRVNIRSTGGDVNDALLIYEALRATGAQITTCCYGYTASAATIVAQAASEGCRLVAPTSLYLIHNSLCSVEGNAEELEAEVELLRQTDQRIAEIYATRSNREMSDMAALMAENGGRGRWLSPAEVITEGLADAIEGATTPQTKSVESPESGVSNSASRAKQGIGVLLKAIGIDIAKETTPNVCDDINYIPHNVTPTGSLISLSERQRSVSATTVQRVEDPDLREAPENAQTMRKQAYDNDARSLRIR